MAVSEKWRRVVAEVGAVASRGGRRRLGLCSIEGTRLFERALATGAAVERAVCTEAFLEDRSERLSTLRTALASSGAELFCVSDEVLAGLTRGRSLGGIVGLARIPEPVSLASLLAGPAAPVFLVCVELNDPGNVGALVRTAHAGGARAVLGAGATDAFHPVALRTSKGSLFNLPVLDWPDWASCAAALREAGVRTFGAVTSGGADPRTLPVAAGPTALILGSEAFGLSEDDQALLDERLTLPMAGGVDSYSVNASAAVLLWEMTRR